MKKVLSIVGALLIAVVIGGCIYLNSLMPIITGYAAKNLASAVFVSGRDAKTVEDLDLNFSFIRFNKNKVDYENKTVTSRFLWGKATAAYREGYGVTLLRGAHANDLEQQDCSQWAILRQRRGWSQSPRPLWTIGLITDIPLLLWCSIKVEWWQSAMIRALHPI